MASTSLSGKTPPGPKGVPIFGSLLSIRNDTHLAINRIAKQYGDICSIGLVEWAQRRDFRLPQELIRKS